MPENIQGNTGAASVWCAVVGSIFIGLSVGFGTKSVIAGIFASIGIFLCLASVNVYIDGAVSKLKKQN